MDQQDVVNLADNAGCRLDPSAEEGAVVIMSSDVVKLWSASGSAPHRNPLIRSFDAWDSFVSRRPQAASVKTKRLQSPISMWNMFD